LLRRRQNLVNLDSFVAHFTQVEVTNQKPLTTSLRAFLRSLAVAQAAVAKPSALHSAICKRAPRFKGFQQQDAQELFLVLIDALEVEEKGVVADTDTDDDEDGDGDGNSDGDGDGDSSPDASHEQPSAPEGSGSAQTFVATTFGGRTVSRVTCGTCGTVTSRIEPFQDVSLPLPKHLSAVQAGSTRSFGAVPKATASARSAAAKEVQHFHDAAEAGGKADASADSKRLSGKEKKRLEKEARRNAKRNRMGAKGSKPKKTAFAKSAGEAALARAAARGDVQNARSGQPEEQKDGHGSSSDSDDGEPAGEDQTQVDGSAVPTTLDEPERDVSAVAEAVGNLPDVILLGPPEEADGMSPAALEPPASVEHDWLDFVDTEAAAAQGQRSGMAGSDSDDDDEPQAVAEHTTYPEANGGCPPASSAADGDACGVLACLRDYCAEEQLTGDARYACEACAKAAAAARPDGDVIRVRRRKKSAKGGGSRSVCWAPDDQLEAVRLIPSVGKGLSLRNPTTFEHDCHGESDEQGSEAPPGGEAEEEASQAEPTADLLERFSSVAVIAEGGGEEVAAPEARAVEQEPAIEVEEEPAIEAESSSPVVASGTPDGAADDDRYEWVELPAPPPPRSILRDAVMRIRFAALPPVLVLSLKRFRQDVRGRTRKLSGHVSFEEELDVSALCDASLQHPCTYQLRGVVEHSGGLSSGHYVAYVRRAGDSAWHYISDRHVRPATQAQVLGAEAYLLFYERAAA
jgi:ubiquitin C-terminal hydrolase